MQINQANSREDFAAFGELVTHYVNWCRTRFAHKPSFVDSIFNIQSLDSEIRELPTKYSPPEGRAFLASGAGAVSGCAAAGRASSGEWSEPKSIVTRRGALKKSERSFSK